MNKVNKQPQSAMKIRFHDCDPFNHLNNARYIDYIMTARGDHLIEEYQLDIYKLGREQGVGWVTAQTQIAYIAPARLMEEVIVQTHLLAFSEKSLHLEATMWNKDKSQLKALMWARLVHYNLRTQKSHPHSEDLMKFFTRIVDPLADPASFEDRVKSFKSI